MIKKFNEEQKISEVGGKAKNLSELSKIVPVPNGYTVTTKGFRKFLKKNELKKQIEEKLKKLKKEDKSISKVSLRLRELVLQSKIPKPLEKEILKSYEELKKDKKDLTVAVRSSAVDEDNPKASFAGQHDTYLNVNKEKLMESVKKCFASLYNERALHYRKNKDILNHEIEIAVIIQEMIYPEASGVLFTCDPVTGDNTKILIETVPGIGEQLVQGKATPDFYKIDKSSGEILEEKIVTQEKKYIKGENTEELIEKKIDRGEGSTPWLNKKHINKLLEHSKKIEKYYKSSQDIEWVIDKQDKIWIVQSRPETTDNTY